VLINQEILSRVDNTLLKAGAFWQEIKTLRGRALRFKTGLIFVRVVGLLIGEKYG
jgi:hypothetical protein